ncbi:hypothetical protein RJ639_036588 [Escallonia herrerae]|uniref:non-specific serine/threonine protein kinase n=1 Tax=Escallonia herrerae TaxID=1293975 RepID=A0AA88WRE8_9ASTE|nr:hypothetical protein RJ639_036588 [Escallonia herrerae]
MRLGTKVGTNEKYVMTSWKSPSDPSTGSFSAGVDPLNIAQVFVWNGSDPYWRSGPWNGQFFIGIPNLEKAYNNGFNFVDDKEGSAYLTFTYANESIITYFSLNSEGTLAQMYWNEGKQNWQVRWSAPKNDCEHYGKCGPFGSCYLSNSPICTCLKGFEPKIPEEWNRGNWTSGCVRRMSLQCDGNNNEGKEDGFLKLTNMKVPDFGSWSNAPEGECGSQCSHNCSCIAYAYHAGIGCMQWSHSLIDIEKFSNRTGATLHVRVAYSELGKKQQRDRSEDVGDTSRAFWQSFNNPGDTFLPEMSAHMNVQTGETRIYYSWRSARDPSPGNYSMGLDPRGSPQIVIWEESNRRWRSGHWNGLVFTGVPSMRALYSYGYRLTDEGNGSMYFTYSTVNSSASMRFMLRWDGIVEQLMWDEGQEVWNVLLSQPSSECEDYNKCGNFGLCNMMHSPICSCIKGFEPRYGDQWSKGNWSGGCVRRTALHCDWNGTGDGFMEVIGVKLPDFADTIVAENTTRGCEGVCLRNCSCNAYSFVSGIGCMTWSGDLVDIEQFEEGGKLCTLAWLHLNWGTLPGGEEIAVKRLSKWSGQGLEELKNELVLIAKLQHRNLVTLLGYCIEGEEKSLIYEYMPNKSLDSFLFEGIQYWNGYMSPEYAMEGLFSVKSDVYSFGVLLLEIVSAVHRPTMSSVLLMLESENASLPIPRQPDITSMNSSDMELIMQGIENVSSTDVTVTQVDGR